MATAEPRTTMKLMHQPAPPTAESAPTPYLTLALCSLASGLLLWASFFPLNQGWCAWFALVPLLFLVRARRADRRTIHVAAMVGGICFYFPALKWMRVADPMMMFGAWPALTFYLALYFPLAIWLLRWIDRLRLPLALTLPVVWVSLEFLRAHFLTGFAWYFLGHTQHDYLPVIQIADLGGAYAVSFLVAAVNGLIFDLIFLRFALGERETQAATRRARWVRATAAVVVMLVAASVAYGFWRLSQNEFAAGPRVTMLQTNIPQSIRNQREDDNQRPDAAINSILKQTQDLTDSIVREKANPDLIIWPETTYPEDYWTVVEGTPTEDLPSYYADSVKDRREFMTRLARYSKANVLLGLNTTRFRRGMQRDLFNSALLVGRDGKELYRYDKIHRVMFGEYLPAKETLPFMKVFSPYEHDYSLTMGEHQTRFVLATERGEFRFGALICFEDSDAPLSRDYAHETADGPAVDFLVNISNDGWFDGTEEHELHLALSRFRAVEARRAVVRSVNMGISALIDGNGRVRALPGPSWQESKKVAAAVTAEVPIDSRISVYARLGDWLAWGCAAGCVGLIGCSLRRGKREPAKGSGVAEDRPRP